MLIEEFHYKMNKIIPSIFLSIMCLSSFGNLIPPSLKNAVVLRFETSEVVNGHGEIIQNIIRNEDVSKYRKWVSDNGKNLVKMKDENSDNLFVFGGDQEVAWIATSYPKVVVTEFVNGEAVKVIVLNKFSKNQSRKKSAQDLLSLFEKKEETKWRLVE